MKKRSQNSKIKITKYHGEVEFVQVGMPPLEDPFIVPEGDVVIQVDAKPKKKRKKKDERKPDQV